MIKVIAALVALSLSITGLAAFASLFDPLPHPITGEAMTLGQSTAVGSLIFHVGIAVVVSGGYLLHVWSVRQFG